MHADCEPADVISMPERMKMAIGIARGLHHLHARCNMAHGNLTSGNVLLDVVDDDDAGGGHHGVKIADYGLIPHLAASARAASSVLGSNIRTAAGRGATSGAPVLPTTVEKPYMKTDVYRLGAVILELLTGNPPERAKDSRMPLWKAETKLRIALASTWCLAWRCMDRSPDARPEALDVLRQLEDITAKSLGYRAIGRDIGGESSTTGDAAGTGRSVAVAKSSADGVAGSSPSTTAAAIPTTGDSASKAPFCRILYLLLLLLLLLLPCTRVNVAQCCFLIPLPWCAFIGLAENVAKEVTSKDSQRNQLEGAGQISNPTPAQEITCGHPGTEAILMRAQYEGDAETDVKHSNDPSPATKTEETSEESAAPDQVTSSPTAQLEGDQDDASHELSGQDKSSGRKRSTGGITDMSSIVDWSKLEKMQVELQMPPTSPPLTSSEPDLIYQSYFLTLHKLGNTSPPLKSDALEGHVNRMVVGLHSMGYPLDAWTKAATLLLVSAKKREYIERCVEDYEANLEVQAEEFTSAINLVREDLSRLQSNLSALEKRNQELDETIAKFVDYLASLKSEQEKVVDEMTVATDQLATAEAKAESVSMDTDRVKQQRSATSLLRDEMLQKVLPSLDEVFDSTFQEIMAKKF